MRSSARHGLEETVLFERRRGAVFINAARGGLVDEGTLYDALTSGHLFGAGWPPCWTGGPR